MASTSCAMVHGFLSPDMRIQKRSLPKRAKAMAGFRENPFRLFQAIMMCGALFAFAAPLTAETFYVDSTDGIDSSTGSSPGKPWKTLEKVNRSRFAPGDTILLRRDRQWRETLEVSSSGNPDLPIVFSAYGSGNNPLIMRTDVFSDWTATKYNNDKNEKIIIWSGRRPGLKNSWGMVRNGHRVLLYRQYADIDIKDISEGYFYAPLNSGHFYFRYDSGDPGAVEIGTRPEAIRIHNRNNIIIDGIDAYGPGGRSDSGSASGYTAVSINGSSRNITLRNMSVTHGDSIAVAASPTTGNIRYINLAASHNGGTGIYMNAQGGQIINCKSYNNGLLESDKGDRGGIGSYKGSDLLIESSEAFNNGPSGGIADFEISVVGTGTVAIMRNYVHDCIQGCIQIAQGGDDSIIAYNIISRYGTVGKGGNSSPGHNSGIRIGGGASGAKNVRIYNNTLHGGRQSADALEAALYVGLFDNSGLIVRNNIFSDNTNHSIYVRGGAILENAQFSNNLFSHLENSLSWKDKKLKTLQHWKTASRQGQGSLVSKPLFSNASGSFSLASDFSLQRASPAIDNGADVELTSDYNGSRVPFGAAQDIGALEFNTSR